MTSLLWNTRSAIGKTVRRWNRASRVIRELIDLERRRKLRGRSIKATLEE